MERLLRTPEAAENLGVAPKTLCNWRVLGTGRRYRKLGAAVVYAVDDLVAFADENARLSTSDLGSGSQTARRTMRTGSRP